jgi:DUF4097 and DUF4098 domain-containing protein YvlB
MMAMSGCKLHNTNDYEKLVERYTNKYGDVTLGESKDANHYTMGGASFANADVTELTIDWVSGTVTIEAYDGSEVVISETSEDALTDSTTMHYFLESDGTLNIRFGIPGMKSQGENLPDKNLLVRVPRTLRLDEVEMNGLGQSIQMDSMHCSTLELNSVSRQITLNECEIDDIEVNSVSTNVEATFSKMPENIELNNVSGNTLLYVPEDAGVTLEWNGLISDFYSELPVAKKGKKKVIGNGACAIECNSVSGKLYIKVKK